MAVSDPRGIKSLRTSHSVPAANGQGPRDVAFAIREDLGEYGGRKAGTPLAFGYRLDLTGTSSLHIAPTGDASQIRLTSSWPHPSFSGAWSPDERQVSPQGFMASWRTTRDATGGQVFWDRKAREGGLLAPGIGAGVALFDPVNVYALSYRATQYAFLFVLFTFTALALTEALAGLKLHVVQYGLVGSAIAVFFLLLIALSEHVDFGVSYASAAAACIALLTFYLRHPLRTHGRTAMFGALFVGLYGMLYVVLRSEDHALLMGSCLVFALLAVTMIATRRVDWNQFGTRSTGGEGMASAPSAATSR
jgi:inner membrane protein